MEWVWKSVKNLVITLLIFPSISFGLEVSQVFTAVGPQGRPLSGANVSVTDSMGAHVDACSNSTCTSVITQVPGTGLFQFWAESGTYNVSITGGGVGLMYVASIPDAAVTGAITDADFPGNYNSFMRRSSVAGTYGQTKINTAAAVDPTANDDVSLDYNVGSLWVNTLTDDVFLCGDATDGSAVWRKVGTANVEDGNAVGDTLYWDGDTWTPTDWLQTGPSYAAVGNTGRLISASSFQVGQINASTTVDIYSKVAAVVLDTVMGQIRFGSTDSSTVPREAAFIKARALDTWPSGDTNAATSLDFQVQANDGSTIGEKILRVQPDLVMVGSDIADGSLQGLAKFVSQGVSIADVTGAKSSVFTNPTALDVTVKSYTLPSDSGTTGYYLKTDGNSLFPTLSWAAIAAAPGDFTVTGKVFATQASAATPAYSFIGDTNSGFTTFANSTCIVDDAIAGLCVTGNAADTLTGIVGGFTISTGVTTNDSLNIIAVGGSGNEIEVNATQFILSAGEVKFSGVSGDGSGKTLCVKANGFIGSCGDTPDGSGVCTCG